MSKRNDDLEKCIVRLISKDRFFAGLIMQMRRFYVGEDHQVKTAAVSITDQINLYIYPPFFANPYKIPEMTQEQQDKMKEKMDSKEFDNYMKGYNEKIEELKAKQGSFTEKDIHRAQEVILIHECMHLMHDHIPRAKKIDTKIGKDGKFTFNMQALNIAMDCAINQLHNIESTVDKFGGITLKSFTEMIGKKPNEVEAKEAWEYYFGLMKENAEDLMEKYGDNLEGMQNQDEHGQWEESVDQGEYAKEIVKGAVRKAEKSAGTGQIGGDVALLIEELFKSEVNWKSELRRFMQGRVKFTKKCTRKKRNRRTGILFQGKKKEYHAHIAIAVDTSGSMSDEDIKRCFTEIHKIATTTNIQLTVIEADSTVTQVYPFDPKKPVKIVGRGGTQYQPAFDKAEELEVNGVIYCGDFDAFDTPKEPKFPTLWLGVGCNAGTKPPADFGKIIYVDTQTGEASKVA